MEPLRTEPKGGKKRILVIDDDDDTLVIIREALESAGYEVDMADSGAEGVLRFRRCRPDLVLVDIGMPGLNGYEVCERLKKESLDRKWHRGRDLGRNGRKHVPVVFLTGYSTPLHVQKAAGVYVDGYLVKPSIMRDLLGRIEKFLTVPPDDVMDALRDADIEIQKVQKTICSTKKSMGTTRSGPKI